MFGYIYIYRPFVDWPFYLGGELSSFLHSATMSTFDFGEESEGKDLERRVKLWGKGRVLLLRWEVAAQEEVVEEELAALDQLRLGEMSLLN